jgi:hypothetical protein
MHDADRKLEQIELKLINALNELYAYRMSQSRAVADEHDPWVPLKQAARTIGKSERATWVRAEKTPGCSWFDGGRRLVNLDLIQVLVAPPKSPAK